MSEHQKSQLALMSGRFSVAYDPIRRSYVSIRSVKVKSNGFLSISAVGSDGIVHEYGEFELTSFF